MKKNILVLILMQILMVSQAEENKSIDDSSITKGNKWYLRQLNSLGNNIDVDEDRIHPVCMKLFKEFEKYNHLKNEGAEYCSRNVLDNFSEFTTPSWSDFESMDYKNKPLLYELAKVSVQGEYYFTGIPTRYSPKRRNPDYLSADQYAQWLEQGVQFQFWDVEFEMPRYKNTENATYKTTILRLSAPSTYNTEEFCEEYPKKDPDQNITYMYFFVNNERTMPIQPIKGLVAYPGYPYFGGKLYLHGNYLFSASLGERGNIVIPGEIGEFISLPLKDNNNNYFNCNIQLDKEM